MLSNLAQAVIAAAVLTLATQQVAAAPPASDAAGLDAHESTVFAHLANMHPILRDARLSVASLQGLNRNIHASAFVLKVWVGDKLVVGFADNQVNGCDTLRASFYPPGTYPRILDLRVVYSNARYGVIFAEADIHDRNDIADVVKPVTVAPAFKLQDEGLTVGYYPRGRTDILDASAASITQFTEAANVNGKQVVYDLIRVEGERFVAAVPGGLLIDGDAAVGMVIGYGRPRPPRDMAYAVRLWPIMDLANDLYSAEGTRQYVPYVCPDVHAHVVSK